MELGKLGIRKRVWGEGRGKERKRVHERKREIKRERSALDRGIVRGKGGKDVKRKRTGHRREA